MPIIGEGLVIGDDFVIGEDGLPELEPEAAYLYQQLGPMVEHDGDTGWTAAHLCAVLMKPVELVSQLAAADGERPGWRKVLDLDEAPAELLPWLGQFNGTPLDDTEAEEEMRRKIREARGSHRGTTRAIVSDVKATLTGTQRVALFERAEGVFLNLVVTRTAETPNSDATRAALNNRQTKPIGAIYTLVLTETWLVVEVEFTYPATGGVGQLEADFATIEAFEGHGVI